MLHGFFSKSMYSKTFLQIIATSSKSSYLEDKPLTKSFLIFFFDMKFFVVLEFDNSGGSGLPKEFIL